MSRCSWLLVSVALLLAPADALADEKGGPAAQAFARGKQLFKDGDYVTAIAEFEKAYQAKPHHAVQCSIALCYEQLNRFVEAAAHYRRCLDEGAQQTPRGEQVRASLKAVEARISWLEVSVVGSGGSVFVDGRPAGSAPCRVPLDPGRHLVEVRRPGARPVSVELKVLAGEQRSLRLVPQEVPVAAPATTQGVTAPLAPPPPPPSRRRLSQAWFWTGLALSVGLGAATGAMGALTLRARSDYNAAPTKQGYDDFVSRRLITNVLTGLLVGVAGTTTVLFFFTDFRRAPRERDDEVAVSVGVVGRF